MYVFGMFYGIGDQWQTFGGVGAPAPTIISDLQKCDTFISKFQLEQDRGSAVHSQHSD